MVERGGRGLGKVGADGWLKGWKQRVGEGGSRGLGKVEAEGWSRWVHVDHSPNAA